MSAEYNENDILGLGENFEPDTDIDDLEASRQTLYRMVFDNSGSMGPFEVAVRESFEFTKDLFANVKEADEILVAITMFNSHVTSGGYQKAENLDTSYSTGGMTALYDAVVDAQNRLVNDNGTGYMQQLIDNGTTTQAAVLVFTDGHDNQSKNKASDAAKALAYLKKEEVPVIFIAFGSDAVDEAKSLGVNEKNIIHIDTDHADTATLGAKLKEVLQIASKSVVSMSKSVGGTTDAGIFSV
jgi:hypothetical protein